ncbi:MAG TPA: helix-turn-helix domain-containing protein [Candidatus Binatia bacterium]
MRAKDMECPAEFTLAMIGGRWKIPLIFHLLNGAKRFSELSRTLRGVSQKVLAQQLREMARDGLVERKVYAEVPPKVEYALTPLGRSLESVVAAMCRWGETHGTQTARREAQT